MQKKNCNSAQFLTDCYKPAFLRNVLRNPGGHIYFTFSDSTVISQREHEYGNTCGTVPWKSTASCLEGNAATDAAAMGVGVVVVTV